MSALSLSLPLARGLRCSSVVSRDAVVTEAEDEAALPQTLLPDPAAPVEVGCSMNKRGLNNVAVVVDAQAAWLAAELELVTALGCTGEDGSSGMAVREGVEALLT